MTMSASERRDAPAKSMHEGITECDDPICCCEPEPRWRGLAEELEREEAARRAAERATKAPKPPRP
jgi:hypothetical protein